MVPPATRLLATFVVLWSGYSPVSLAQGENDANCLDLGFTSMQLCSDCDAFAEYVKDEELVADCRKCCAKDSKRSENMGVTYTEATLEICK
ncbi:hypothetical protein CYMTET_22955 [Cymbomonas tetramitiformis]|uniref:Selenoprotein F/M domain-containing protein n=1 Tax=Cymbomonas tetramitiformis TaxID=36881 RepID=A0AAE0L1F0_9CHLO|nr:hypothetical protein CYMTET_22955 [Cymbomonas tetramitiformis]